MIDVELPAIDSSMTPDEALRLRELARGQVVLEVGSWRGFSTVLMAQVAKFVHAVDHHMGDEHAGHDESLSFLMAHLDQFGVRETVAVHVGSAENVLPLISEWYFGLAFLDAFHEADAVRRDLDLILPLVRPGGVIAFHDYGRYGVKPVVDETVSAGWLDWIGLTETLAVTRKT